MTCRINPERYKKKRAEIWGELGTWLDDENLDVQIPDSDELQSDLCTPKCKRDSMDRILLEAKDEIRRRMMPSPDLGDAPALTFADLVLADDAWEDSFEPDWIESEY